ncbi:MAG: phosphate ABC transporter permease subunit PstC [Nitriliruptorales bacterium]
MRGRPRRGEKVILGLLWVAGSLSVVTTIAMVATLLYEGSTFFRDVSFVRFFTDREWQPFGGVETGQFGVLELVSGTLLVTGIAMIVAVPLGLGAAAYLSEYAHDRVRRVLKPTLELLAGIPTVVLGFFALTFVTPLLQSLFGPTRVGVFNALSAGLVVGIMIIPTVASLSEDAMSAVPNVLREGAYGLGATRRHVTTRIVFPAAISGIVAATILAMGRAIGETMIVAIAAGNLPNLTLNPFDQIQTMTAYIIQAVGGEAARGSLTFESIFAVGLLLFAMTFVLNIVANWVVRRFREVY